MSKPVDAKGRFDFLQKYLNSSRKEATKKNDKSTDKAAASSSTKKDEDWLTKWVEADLWFILISGFCLHFYRKAIEELQREICINKVKRKAFGSVTVPKARTNKRFLKTTLTQCLSHNQREQKKHSAKSTDKLKELDRSQRLKNSKEKFGERKHEYKKPEKRKRRHSSSSSSDD